MKRFVWPALMAAILAGCTSPGNGQAGAAGGGPFLVPPVLPTTGPPGTTMP